MAALELTLTKCEGCNINDCKGLKRILHLLTQHQQVVYGDHADSISNLVNDW